MTGFTKLHGSTLLGSTIWREDPATKVTWITMLAMADRDGLVEASVPGLAHLAGVTMEEAEHALAKFLAPDPYSRTPDHEGRRIEKVDGGWLLINYDKYRAKQSPEEVAEKHAARQVRYRQRKKNERHQASPSVTPRHAASPNVTSDESDPIADADSREQIAEAVKPSFTSHNAPSKKGSRISDDFQVTEEHRQWAAENGMPKPADHIGAFVDHWRAQPGARGVRLDWDATFRNWLRKAAEMKRGNGKLAQPQNLAVIDYRAGLKQRADGSYSL